MTTVTIQQALRPIFITCFVLGLGVYPLKKPNSNARWIAYLSILYSLTIWFSYAYLLYYTVTLFTWQIIYQSTVVITVVGINTFTTIIAGIMGFYHQKRLELCVKKLAVVDDTLEELGTPKMYRKMHMRSKQVVITWIMYSFAVNFCDTIWWLNTKETASWGLLIAHILNHCLHSNAFIDLLFIFFLWYIGTRFDKINEYTQYLLTIEEHGLRCTWRKPIIAPRRYASCIDNYKRTLWTSMHLYFELCRIARDINLIFGTQMTFEMASYFVYITSMCYGIFLLQSQEYPYKVSIFLKVDVGIWFLAFFVRSCMINYICENVMLKAKKIDKVIYQLTSTLQYADIWKEIYQFILQTMHHPLKFTGMGLFYFGNTFYRKFYTTVLMFVIIMAQMKMSISTYLPNTPFAKKKISISSTLTISQ